jgi:undecaprenyl-diphosphatase
MMLTYLQAIVLGIIQGITEPFPISSLGHNVLIPQLFGWHNIVTSEPKSESFFLAFLVALHVATALALFIFYRKTWYKLIRAFFSSVKDRQVKTPYQKLIWLLIIATIPAGLTGVLFEHLLRTQFAKPMAAAVFLVINGVILFIGDKYAAVQAQKRRDFNLQSSVEQTAMAVSKTRAGIIGTAQVLALIAGISRSGVTMVSGLFSGLDYQDSARFSFLLATPVIAAAGLYKLPDLLGVNGNSVRSQILVGAVAAFIAAYFSVRFLDKYFRTNRLRPFAIYSVVFGLFMVVFIAFGG